MVQNISNNSKKVKNLTKKRLYESLDELSDKELYELINHSIKEYRERPARLLVKHLQEEYGLNREKISDILQIHAVTVSRIYPRRAK